MTTVKNLMLSSMLALAGALVFGLGPAMAAVGDYPFEVVAHETVGASYQAVAENKGPVPITVYANLMGKNFRSPTRWPVTTVVPPYSALLLGSASALNRSARAREFHFRYSYHFGRLDAIHDLYATYRLPFEDGRGFEVTQAYGNGTLTTHSGRASKYAVDFAMPVGNAVLAARAGVVADVTLSYSEGVNDAKYIDKGNAVTIIHDDGTVGSYVHLSPGRSALLVGQRVNTGDLIGYSGNTGYTSGPHLHFGVSRPRVVDGKVTLVSIPVLFYADDPAARFSVRAGTSTKANYGNAVTSVVRRAARVSPGWESQLRRMRATDPDAIAGTTRSSASNEDPFRPELPLVIVFQGDPERERKTRLVNERGQIWYSSDGNTGLQVPQET